ncbi:MAG: hypothetical protein WEF50_01975 [Myxococcota bacterium]
MATIQEMFEGDREAEWRRAGVPDSDIVFSRTCGIDGRDVRAFREFSRENVMVVVRNPKLTARPWHGSVPPKHIGAVGKDDAPKTGTSGVLVTKSGRILVSDYDLMSVWRTEVSPPAKVFISAAHGAARGKWSEAAVKLIVRLNARLVSKVQHGCQDDYHSGNNPGVKHTDHFSAFRRGLATHLPNPTACAAFYAAQGLAWPYDASGKYAGPIAGPA